MELGNSQLGGRHAIVELPAEVLVYPERGQDVSGLLRRRLDIGFGALALPGRLRAAGRTAVRRALDVRQRLHGYVFGEVRRYRLIVQVRKCPAKSLGRLTCFPSARSWNLVKASPSRVM